MEQCVSASHMLEGDIRHTTYYQHQQCTHLLASRPITGLQSTELPAQVLKVLVPGCSMQQRCDSQALEMTSVGHDRVTTKSWNTLQLLQRARYSLHVSTQEAELASCASWEGGREGTVLHTHYPVPKGAACI